MGTIDILVERKGDHIQVPGSVSHGPVLRSHLPSFTGNRGERLGEA